MDEINKKNSITLLFASICAVLFFFFPIKEYKFEIFIGTIVFLFLLPVLYNKIILKEKINNLGFTSMSIEVRDVIFIIIAIILGSLLGFIIINFELGVENYIQVLSKTIFVSFKAFVLYEIFFSSIMLFLFTFFTWGFIYSIKYNNEIITFLLSTLFFIIFFLSFYMSIWLVLPSLVPVLFVPYIRNEKNIIYMFLTIFVINLVIDTLVVKVVS
jgi:hypothetical protein